MHLLGQYLQRLQSQACPCRTLTALSQFCRPSPAIGQSLRLSIWVSFFNISCHSWVHMELKYTYPRASNMSSTCAAMKPLPPVRSTRVMMWIDTSRWECSRNSAKFIAAFVPYTYNLAILLEIDVIGRAHILPTIAPPLDEFPGELCKAVFLYTAESELFFVLGFSMFLRHKSRRLPDPRCPWLFQTNVPLYFNLKLPFPFNFGTLAKKVVQEGGRYIFQKVNTPFSTISHPVLTIWTAKKLDDRGVEPLTSRMQSEHSTFARC